LTSLVFAAVASLLFGASLASAAEGTGPADAYAPDGTWHQIDRGQTQWFTFTYGEKDEQVLIKMNAKPADGAKFAVLTPEEIRLWEKTGDMESCGCSSEDKFAGADQSWSGSFNIPGTYAIVVKHTGHHNEATFYSLSASGKGVSMAQRAEPEMVAAAPAAAAVAPAMNPFEDWMAMPAGASHWETFNYDKADTQIDLMMDAEPNHAVVFSVWTPEQVRQYSLGMDVDPVGWGTVNEEAPGEISWSGSFTSPGKYYVRVDHLGSGTSYCKLTLKGENAWF
jgi:hypothetical protein